MAVANQKIVEVNKQPTNKQNVYACINIDALDKAALNLTKASTFKLWMYFAKNQNNYKFELSAVAVMNFCNITEKTYREAVKELISKRYLVQREKNYYDFYEIPKEVEVIEDGTIIECHTSTKTIR